MSMHTPGPWRFINGRDIFSVLGADSGDECPAAADEGWHIAVIPDTYTNVGFGSVELGESVKNANGRLIAQAPAMYEALEGLRDLCEKAGFPCDKANAVLAAARGESHE